MNFEDSLPIWAARIGVAVDRLVNIGRGDCYMERMEYRGDPVEVVKEEDVLGTGEKMLMEKDVDTVRVSFVLQWSSSCVERELDQIVQNLFYKRLGSSSLTPIRRPAVSGYDVSLIFTFRDDPVLVEKMVAELCSLWRILTKQIRLRQIIGNRKCNFFQNLLAHQQGRTEITDWAQVSPKPGSAEDTWSVDTEWDGHVEELEEEENSLILIN